MSLALQQMADDLMAVPAFIPATICPGYLAAWLSNLFGFRSRSLIERLFWSVPLSIGLSPFFIVLIARYVGLKASSAAVVACAIACLVIFGFESSDLRRNGKPWVVGFHPLGGTASLLMLIVVAATILSLVDLQHGPRLFPTLFTWDQAYRVSWTESVLHTGVPPSNPLYLFHHAAPMRNYYYWYVLCAAIAQIFHLPTRAVVSASCVWTAFSLCCLIGLYLKHFLCVGPRLRRQMLIAITLLVVTGLDICVNVVQFFERLLPFDFEWWSKEPIYSWYGSILWVPHHVAAIVCCMFAPLLAHLAANESRKLQVAAAVFIGVSLASAFGMSIFVPFGFFLVMIVWALWQVAIERAPRPAVLLAAGGGLSLILLGPFLWDLTHNESKVGGSGHIFGFHVREMIDPEWLVASPLLRTLAIAHPMRARVTADWILLLPGYGIELGFFALVLLVFLVPQWRGRAKLTPAHRALLVIAVTTLPIITLLRSWVLPSNDFGWRAAMILQFPLLLLASELLASRRERNRASDASAVDARYAFTLPRPIRSLVTITIFIGILSTVSQALMVRSDLIMVEVALHKAHRPQDDMISHFAFIQTMGLTELAQSIAPSAVVQANPQWVDPYFRNENIMNMARQTAIVGDGPGCGSELGGDPSGCPAMAAAIDSLYNGPSPQQAPAVCRQYGIQYLVANIYDPAWHDKQSWVWTLNPIVAHPEFRALECGH